MRTRKRALYVATESTYGVDPDADGSDYLYMPTLELGELKDTKELLQTNYMVGRANSGTAPLAGRDGWSFDCVVPLYGIAAAVGDGDSHAADDWLDQILDHIFATGVESAGEGITAGATTTTFTVDSNSVGTYQALVCVYDPAVPAAAPRSQIGVVTSVSGTAYTIAPPMDEAPGGSAVVYGGKHYLPGVSGGGTTTLSFAYDLSSESSGGELYTLSGGRCTSWSIKMDSPGQIWKLHLSFSGDSRVSTGKGSLPAFTAANLSKTPVKGMLSPLWFGTTKYAVSSIEIDGGMVTAEQGSTAAVNGRANWDVISQSPTIKITPLYTDAIAELRRGVTKGRVMIQLGAGGLSGGILNVMAFAAEEAVITSADPVDDNGRVRQAITLNVTDKVQFSTALTARTFTVSRW